ncbi:hypothetical protein EDB86DRAFT_3085439 [Lactarius hatsudake]|nr:hypothetical protein EDB86DRAFT_3085439 [Lactarius hatsudake]
MDYTFTPVPRAQVVEPDPALALLDDEEDKENSDPSIPFFLNDPTSPTFFPLLVRETGTTKQTAWYIYYPEMEVRNCEQTENTGPGPKRNLRSSASAHVTSNSNAQAEQKKTKSAPLQELRALLEKEGLLKKDEDITAKSIHAALKLMYVKYNSKLSPDMQKIILSITACISMLAADKGQEHNQTVETLAQRISDKLETSVNREMGKISNLIETSLANQSEMQSTSKKLDESAGALHKAIEVVNSNLNTVVNTLDKLTTTVSLYKEVLLLAPAARPMPAMGRSTTGAVVADPRVTRDLDRKSKQVLVDVFNKDITNSSLEELKSKSNKIIAEDAEKPPADAEVQEIHKLRNGGLILQFKTKEAAEWFKQPHIEMNLLPKIDSSATVKGRSFQILVPRVPVIFDPERKEDWTLHARPQKLSYEDKFPAKFAVASLPPPPTQGTRQLPTRPITGKKRGPKKRNGGGEQNDFKDFYTAAGFRPISRAACSVRDDQTDAASEDEYAHLNTAHLEE